MTQSKNGPKNYTDISPKKTYRWLTNMKSCSKLLNIRVMPIKTTMRYHLTLVRTAIIKKSTNNKAGEGVEKREHSCTVGRNVN